MGVIEAIKKGFGVTAKGMSLVAVLFVFNLLGNLATLPFAPTPGSAVTAQATLPLLAISLVFILISIFIQGGSLGLVRDIIKEGSMKLSALMQYGTKYYVRLFILGLIILLFVAVVALLAALTIGLTAPLNSAVVSGTAIVAVLAITIALALYFFIPFILSPYAIVCDELSPIEALKKGIAVGRNPFSRVFTLLLLVVLLVLIALGVGFLIGLLVGLVSVVIPTGAAKMLMLVVSSIVNSYLGVVATAAFMAYYLAKKDSPAKAASSI